MNVFLISSWAALSRPSIRPYPRARKSHLRSRTLARWMAASVGGHDGGNAGDPSPLFFANECRWRACALFRQTKRTISLRALGGRAAALLLRSGRKSVRGKGRGFPENESMWCAQFRAPHVGAVEKSTGYPFQFFRGSNGNFHRRGEGERFREKQPRPMW
jgi:hypothetical protein